ncbi:MAG: SRPBCC family protein [Solirubrobacterales bacterium]|nr:SRPBCC family protein [Solirubrobacterales bacterium]
MSTVKVTTEINAPPERVWETVMDPDRLGDWVTIHRSVKDVSDRPLSQGSTMEQVLHMRGFSFTVRWTLTAVSEPNHAEWEGRGPAGSRALIRYELSGDDNGPTNFDYTNEFTPPGGKLGGVASRVIVGAASEREADKSLTQLKKLIEGG